MEIIKSYPQKNFEHAVVAVDVVIFSIINNELNVLLLELKEPPYEGLWALPGGLVAPGETLEACVNRHLLTKANVENVYSEQLYTFGDPSRDPHGSVVSVAYMGLTQRENLTPKTTDRYSAIEWKSIKNLPSLAYDHAQIIETASKRLQGKLSYTNIVVFLLPTEFTLTQLQKVYETILGKTLDKRNFRKKIMSLGIVEQLNKQTEGDAYRPAALFKFKSPTLQEAEIL